MPWGVLLRLVLTYLPAWLFVAATAAVLRAFGETPGWQAPAAAVLAWVCGFLAVPVPAGAGVGRPCSWPPAGWIPGWPSRWR